MHKILIVEDEEAVQEMLKRFLEHEGYLVITADKGRTALNWVKEVRVDLAIVDLGLPDMNGMEVCRAIKEEPRTSSMPVIILTGNTSNEARIEGNLDASVELFLNKPISIEDLKKAVSMVFEKSEKKKLLLRNSIKEKLGY
ncbi:MAG: response regulator transcription factor [Elusimicrobiales bacterium]|nr:response regulator transcription factor [Elusimicrobiales bacterium]